MVKFTEILIVKFKILCVIIPVLISVAYFTLLERKDNNDENDKRKKITVLIVIRIILRLIVFIIYGLTPILVYLYTDLTYSGIPW